MLYNNILDSIGRTPLVKLHAMTDGTIFGKAEMLNPGGSVKDRVGLAMIEKAEQDGRLRPGSTIVEPSSGNTGIGLTLVGVQKGYRVVIVMPDNMSEERKRIIKALGGEMVLTPAEESIDGCLKRVEQMRADDPGIFVPQQFENPDNPEVHYRTTGPEIWDDLEGEVTAFVAGVGSGGTLAGVGRLLRERKPDVRLVAVEPDGVSALLGHEPGLHQIQGIGDGFIPAVLDPAIVDEVITVTDDDAISTTRRLASEEGLLVGTSSGANVWAAMQLVEELGRDDHIVTVLPDRAERYFSTALI